MVKVNPLQARRFAEAIGQRAKTDAVDAAMLARLGALDALQKADQRLRQIEHQIAAIDAELRALCRADAELKARLDILVSIRASARRPR